MPHVGDAPGDRQTVAAGHRARGSPFQAGDDLQQAGFAGAAGAEQGDEAAAGDVEAQPVEDDLLTETQAEIPHLDAGREKRGGHEAFSPICQNADSNWVAVVKICASSVKRPGAPRWWPTVSSSSMAARTPAR